MIGHTATVLCGVASRIFWKLFITSLCRYRLTYSPCILLASLCYIHKVVLTKVQFGRNSKFIDFLKAFDSIYSENTEEILIVYGLPKETVTAITLLYKNMKAMVCWLDSNTNFFDIVDVVLQGDTLEPYMFMICLDYVFQISIDLIKVNCFILKKGKKQMISYRNYDRCRVSSWSSTSCKYTYPNWISAA